jgi:hypothetical protein
MIIEMDNTIAMPVINLDSPEAVTNFISRLEQSSSVLAIVKQSECDRHKNMQKFARGRLPIQKVCLHCYRVLEQMGAI